MLKEKLEERKEGVNTLIFLSACAIQKVDVKGPIHILFILECTEYDSIAKIKREQERTKTDKKKARRTSKKKTYKNPSSNRTIGWCDPSYMSPRNKVNSSLLFVSVSFSFSLVFFLLYQSDCINKNGTRDFVCVTAQRVYFLCPLAILPYIRFLVVWRCW